MNSFLTSHTRQGGKERHDRASRAQHRRAHLAIAVESGRTHRKSGIALPFSRYRPIYLPLPPLSQEPI
jgi:hypothetical protein